MALPFRPVDVPAQAKAYRLEPIGAEDGAVNHPESGSDVPALAEQTIMTAIHADRERCVGDLTAHLRAHRDGLATLQTAMDIAGIRHSAGLAMSDLAAIRSSHASTLERRTNEAAAAKAEYDTFRSRNRIERAARQPKNRPLAYAWMAFLIVIEGAFNTVFFATGSDQGLLGGLVMAAAFSAVNVVAGALNGWFPLRWTHHRNIPLKLTGIVTFLVLLFGSFALNVFVAHYRDAAQVTSDQQPLLAATAGFLRDPFGLQSIQSWLLLALGLGCAGTAISKGYHLDDPYPAYGAYDRRRLVHLAAYDEARRDFVDQATQARDALADKLDQTIQSLRASSSQRQHLIASRARNLSEFEGHEVHLADAAQQLLSIYRRANETARSTPSPARFRSVFRFPDHAIDRPAIRTLLEDQGLEVDANQLIAELDGLRRDAFERYEEILRVPTAGAAE